MKSRRPTHLGTVLFLEDVMKSLGITITEAAKDLGISRKTLSEIVNGRCGLSPEIAVRIGKSPRYLRLIRLLLISGSGTYYTYPGWWPISFSLASYEPMEFS